MSTADYEIIQAQREGLMGTTYQSLIDAMVELRHKPRAEDETTHQKDRIENLEFTVLTILEKLRDEFERR